MPLDLKRQLELGGCPAMIDLLCELTARLDRLELDRAQPRAATSSAGPAAPEIVEDLGHGWQIVRTPVLKPPQTAQEPHGAPQPTQPV